jgi:phosphate/sulfate permease
MKTRESFCQTFGLHPVIGFGLFTVDSVLFASEVATFEATWALTIPIGILLTAFSVLAQKRLYGDSWRAALGKGVLVGVLTAIPLPIASLSTLIAGIIGVAKGLAERRVPVPLLAAK